MMQYIRLNISLILKYSDQLAQLKMNYTSNVHTISDIKNTLKENAEQCVNLGEFSESLDIFYKVLKQCKIFLRIGEYFYISKRLRVISEKYF